MPERLVKQRVRFKSATAMFLLFTFFLLFVGYVQAEETYPSWDEYREANGLSSYTWNDVADAI